MVMRRGSILHSSSGHAESLAVMINSLRWGLHYHKHQRYNESCIIVMGETDISTTNSTKDNEWYL